VKNWSRYCLTLLLLCSLFAQQAGKLLLVADYFANKASYLALCENKSRPSLHCDGQCLLMKKMQKADKKDLPSPEKKLEWKIEVLSRKSFYTPLDHAAIRTDVSFFVPLSTGLPIDIPHSFFHPPAVV